MTTLTWNGTSVPEELRDLPPGRYVITGVDDAPPLTEAEEAGLREALNQARQGKLIEHAAVKERVRELRRR